MTPDIALTLGIILAAIVLFATEKLRVDVIALLVLLTVGLTGLVDAEHVFSGFANPAVITVWAVYIVSGALFRTGVADLMGRFILRLSGDSEARLIAVIMITCGTMSAFMNNGGRNGYAASGDGGRLPPDQSAGLKTADPAGLLIADGRQHDPDRHPCQYSGQQHPAG